MKNNNLKTKLTTVAAFVAMTVGANQAFAADGTTANATILNQVKVTYTSVNNTASIFAYDDVSILVKLKEAAVTINYTGGDDASETASGIATLNYTIDSNANGVNDYTFTATPTGTTNMAVNDPDHSVTVSLVNTLDNSTTILPGTKALGGGIAIADGVADKILLPGGSLHGFIPGDYVVIDVGGSDVVYQVNTFLLGTPPTVDGSDIIQDGTDGYITLYVENTTTPADATVITAGSLIQERIYVRVEVEGTNTDPDGDPIAVPVNLTVVGDSNDGDANNDTAEDDRTPEFKATYLSVEKLISTDGGNDYYVTGDGDLDPVYPGSILHYQLTIPSPSAPVVDRSKVSNVVISDILPDYTSLTTAIGDISITYYDVDDSLDTGTSVDVILSNPSAIVIADGASFVKIDETVKIYASIEANTGTLTINLGENASGTDGGEMAPADSIVITYSVIVD